ncbi:hypothetical protein J6TS1_33830 [Siminovitchia terrae]|uniref:DUF2178 domain-containing protein n=1 Tax=Siminovitchia terrae TaxID=1914933 RepID=A0ABQ4KZR8_SIMTE|nr:hypothetical protein [Siminovitchia terrae]GIN92911.1 hypothetical protein J22TS1_39620 [Siminovitchia terrae]GIN97513.1 hypothetical protein J6TS1_33830 [Siminovitchia terrae]
MLIGLGVMIVSFILVGVLAIWGVKYTRRHIHEDRKKKFAAAKNLLLLGIVVAVGYIIFAKKFSHNIDLVMSWILLASGCFFASGLAFFIGYYHEKENSK